MIPYAIMNPTDTVPTRELTRRWRAAIADRAKWFALLYREFYPVLGAAHLESAARKGIYAYGVLKARQDDRDHSAASLLQSFVSSGAAEVFDAEIQEDSGGILNTVRRCALVDGWKAMGCTREEIRLFCDIAMEGDRGRAETHGIELELRQTLAKQDDFCWICLKSGGGENVWDPPPENKDVVPRSELVSRLRSAMGDRAIWFALLFEEFKKELPEETVVRHCRAAIRQFGTMKAAGDTRPFSAKEWVLRHREKGSAELFDSDISYDNHGATQQMKQCPLVDAWRNMGYSTEYVALFCDIAMDGDRGRADAHPNIEMELHETLARGCDFCRLELRDTNS